MGFRFGVVPLKTREKEIGLVMEARLKDRTVKELVDLRREGFMVPNPEYQRGEVWTLDQKKKLIEASRFCGEGGG